MSIGLNPLLEFDPVIVERNIGRREDEPRKFSSAFDIEIVVIVGRHWRPVW